ncbi:MAG: DUF1822 family protein [Candidatus Gastranaerophilales bacterium]|nr:DUF1822 family protein [Candidatus Gastranaerophilales bacterium]
MELASSRELTITADALKYAKIISAKIENITQRKRAFASIVALDAFADFMLTQDIEVSITKNLFKIAPVNEEFEISDVYFNNWKLDIRIISDNKYLSIPKSHFNYDIVADFYIAINVDKSLKKAELIGFTSKNNISKAIESGDYFIMDTDALESFDSLLEQIKEPKPVDLVDEDHEQFREMFLSYLDEEIPYISKKKMIKHLIDCAECRADFVEFYDFESIVTNSKDYPEILEDKTLGFIGATITEEPQYEGKEEIINIIEPKTEEQDDENDDILDELFDDDDNLAKNETTKDNDEEDKKSSPIVPIVPIVAPIIGGAAIAAPTINAPDIDLDLSFDSQDKKESLNENEDLENLTFEDMLSSNDLGTSQEDDNLEILTENNDISLDDLDDLIEDELQSTPENTTNTDTLDLIEDHTKPSEIVEENQNTDEIIEDSPIKVEETSTEENVIDFSLDDDIKIDDEMITFDDEAKKVNLLEKDINTEEVPSDNTESEEDLDNEMFSLQDFSKAQEKNKAEENNELGFDENISNPELNELSEIEDFSIEDDSSDAFTDNKDLFDTPFENINEDIEITSDIDLSTDENTDISTSNDIFKGTEIKSDIDLSTNEENQQLSDMPVASDDGFEELPEDTTKQKYQEMFEPTDTSNIKLNDFEEIPPVTPENSGDFEDFIAESNTTNKNSDSIVNTEDNEISLSEPQDNAVETIDEEEIAALYDEQTQFQDDKSNLIEMNEKKTPIDKKKMIILSSCLIGCLVLGTILGVGNMMKSGKDKTEAANLEMMDDLNAPPINEAPQGGSHSPMTANELAKAPMADTPRDVNRAMTNVFSDNPSAVTVTKIFWEVSQAMATNKSFAVYLQQAGKNIQTNLRAELVNSTETAYNNKIKVEIKVAKDNKLKEVSVLDSSGSDQIDNIVLQTIKETLPYIKVPQLSKTEENKLSTQTKAALFNKDNLYDLKLVINF